MPSEQQSQTWKKKTSSFFLDDSQKKKLIGDIALCNISKVYVDRKYVKKNNCKMLNRRL